MTAKRAKSIKTIEAVQTDASTPEFEPDRSNAASMALHDLGCFSFDLVEVEVLHAFRTLLMCSGPDGVVDEGELVALKARAQQQFGCYSAGSIVGAVGALVDALRAARAHPFYFISPRCTVCRERICEDEYHVLSALATARQSDWNRLHARVRQLTGAQPEPVLVHAFRSLAHQLLVAEHDMPLSAGPRPVGYLVH